RFPHVCPLGQLHLQGMHAMLRRTVVTGNPAATETSVDHIIELVLCRDTIDHRLLHARRAAGTTVRADVEYGQFAVEQAWYARTNGMAVIQQHEAMSGLESLNFS